jgi:DNA-binding response OmpR family regulator
MKNSLNHRARILIVEDEPLIALDLEGMLLDADFEVVGIAGTIKKALVIIEMGELDAVLLDANLKGVSSAPVAVALAVRGLPFLVLSGYAADQQPEAFRAGSYLQKPASPAQIIKLLNDILSEKQS